MKVLQNKLQRTAKGQQNSIEVEVKGALNELDARMIAKQVVGSSLVKTAVYGADANWGRIIGAVGQTNARINPENVDVSIGNIDMLKA